MHIIPNICTSLFLKGDNATKQLEVAAKLICIDVNMRFFLFLCASTHSRVGWSLKWSPCVIIPTPSNIIVS